MPHKPKAIPTERQRARHLNTHAHEPGHLIESITKADFDHTLTRYKWLLMQLTEEETTMIRKTGGILGVLLMQDRRRYEAIPQMLQGRHDEGGSWLDLGDVDDLVSWQKQHAGLDAYSGMKIMGNTAEKIKSVTHRAYREYGRDSGRLSQALDILTTLDGVGIETATLWLAVYDPEVPFLSPELCRWTQWDGKAGKKDSGWRQPLDYSYGTYARVRHSMTELRDRLAKESGKEVSLADVERVAWVLGREAEGFVAVEPEHEKRKRMEAETVARLESTYQHLTEAEAKEAARYLLKPDREGWATGLTIMSGKDIKRCSALAEKEWGPRSGGGFTNLEAVSEYIAAEKPQTKEKPTAKATENPVRRSKRNKGPSDSDGNVQSLKGVSK
jgi:hypothetical protein